MKNLHVDNKQIKVVFPLSSLINTNILCPEIQRIIDEERVNKIVQFQYEYYMKHKTFLFIGDLTLATVDRKDFFIIDGLHRLSAIKKLAEIEDVSITSYNICVNVIEVADIEEMEYIFRIINRAQPIPEYIMESTFSKSKQSMLKDFERQFISKYKCYISDAFKPQRPNIKIKKVMDNIYGSNLLEIFNDGYEIFKYFLYINSAKLKDLDPDNKERCEKKNTTDFLYITSDPKNIWMRDRTWINEYLALPKSEEQPQSHIFSNTFAITTGSNTDWYYTMKPKNRKSIPAAIRCSVWRKYNDSLDGYCPLCFPSTIISIDNFDCGHIISYKNGGKDSIDNLIPLCVKCNRSMGATDIKDYCEAHGIANPCREDHDHDHNQMESSSSTSLSEEEPKKKKNKWTAWFKK